MAVHELHLDLVGLEAPEVDVGLDLEGVADLRRVGDARRLDVLDLDARPRGADLRLVGREVLGPGELRTVEGAARPGSGAVELHGVVLDHAARQHLGAQRLEGVRHHRDPPLRQAVDVAVVELRGDVVLDEVVERGGLDVVATVGVLDAVGGRDGPPVAAVEPLVPPAVEDREVETAVEGSLHARGAARLEGPERVVEPDVAARVEVLRHGDVVVGQEDDAVAHLGVVGEARPSPG